MPVATLKPSAAGFYSQWPTVQGGSRPGIVQGPDDEDTSYIQNFDTAARDSYAMDDLPADALSVTTHTIKNRARYSVGAGPAISNFIRKSGVDTDGTIVPATASYVTRTDVDLSGGPLTVAVVNAAECGVWATSMAGQYLRCTTIAWDVNYVPAPGGFISLVVSLLSAACLGSGLTFRDAVALASAIRIRSRGRLRVLPHEFAELLAELRGWRHAVMVG